MEKSEDLILPTFAFYFFPNSLANMPRFVVLGFAAAFVLYQGKKIFPVETESIFYGKRKEYNYILLSKLRL